MRQMPGQPGRAGVAHGEAGREAASDEACGPPHEHPGAGSARSKAGAGTLLDAALTRENLKAAWKRVKANKGVAGVDGLDIEQTAELLRTSWSQTRQALLAGTYRPQPVHKVMIPKPDGSQRELGIPTVLDRLIQQALLQVLYLLGWRAYFGLAQTPGVWRELDEWLRHRLRAIQLKHWNRPGTMYRALQALGAVERVAGRVAANSRRWWRNSDHLLKTVLTIAYFDKLGVPRLS